MVDACIWCLAEAVPFLAVGIERRRESLEIRLGKEIEDAENPELSLVFGEGWNGTCGKGENLD
jgi:hypothetical protein